MKENARERAGQLTEVQIGKDTGTLLVPDVYDWKVLALEGSIVCCVRMCAVCALCVRARDV